MYYKSCFENGIKFINDITNNDGSIYTYDELKATYNVTINFLQYSGLIRSILAWKKTLNLANIRHKVVNPIIPFSVQIYLKSKKGAQDMYNLLNKTTDIPAGKISWTKKYIFEEDEWGKYFLTHLKSPKTVTPASNLGYLASPQDNFSWVPNCSLGPPGWETKVSSKKIWFGLCEIAWFLCQHIANLRKGVCL